MARQYRSFLLLPGLLALSLAGRAQAPPAAKPTGLKPGKAITQDLKSGQVYEYLVPLKKGEALKATVEQKGIDVIVTAYSPDGTKLGTYDSATEDRYQEVVTVQAPSSGRYRLTVAPLDPKTPAGAFVITLNGILTPTQYAESLAADRQRADAAAAYLRAPHPDKTKDEQREEVLRRHPGALMVTSQWPEVEGARWLEGTWSMTRTFYATPTRPEETMPAITAVMRFSPNNPTQLETDWEGGGKFQTTMVYEPFSRQWVQAFMNSYDPVINWGLLKSPGWQNNQLVMEGETASMGAVSRERRTWTKTNDRTLRVLTEERKGDGNWLPLFESQYTKPTPATITAK